MNLEHVPTEMPTSNRPMNAGSAINDDASRLDAVAKVTGAAKYAKDMHLPNALYIAFIRCPFGAAELASADADAARAVPGVVEVELAPRDCTYHGQNVGHVAAESPLAVKRALRALNPQWRRKPVKTTLADSAPDLPEPDAAAAEILTKADLKLQAVYSTPIQTHSSLETHGGVVEHNGERATVYASTQGTSSVRDGLDRALGLRQSDFEVVCEHVGGGFGSKLGGPGKEITLAARIAAKYKRPAYLFCNRAEEHLDTGNRPSSRTLVRLGFRKDGSILGGEIRTWGGVGVARGGGGVRIPSNRYRLGEIKSGHADVSFNNGGPRAFRAPGHPQAAFAEELMLDEVAAAAGLDPLALKKRLAANDTYREMFDLGAALIGWKERRPSGSQDSTLRVGFGAGTANWGSPRPGANAEVVINRDGSIECRTGTQDIGTGQRTTMGIMAADAIGVPLRLVNVRIGRSSLPPGPGSGGSVTSPMTAPTMAAAARAARDKLLAAVAEQSGCPLAELSITGGGVHRAGRPFLTWQEACSRLPNEGALASASSGDPGTGSSEGVQLVRVEVDADTGIVRVKHVVAIQSCGRVICRKTAESQIIGGVIQGISFALFENQILDRNVGAMVNPNFEFYKILGPGDMPHIEPVLWARGQTGVRALGEPPTIPTAGAIACAVFNAVGTPVRHLPLTPDKVLAALRGVIA